MLRSLFFFMTLFASLSALAAVESISTDLKEYAIDQSVQIRTSGLIDHSEYTVQVSTKDRSGRLWSSTASFIAQNGQIDFSQKPISGSYSVASREGLFWSMLPSDYKFNEDIFHPSEKYQIDVKLSIGEKFLSQTSFVRRLAQEKLIIQKSRTAESYYDLVIPKNGGKKAAILLLGGSEGGLDSGNAQIIASHGYVVMSLAYFGVAPLPLELKEIPLEYIQHNVKILRAHPQVDSLRVFIWGTSRGGELALLTAATFPEFFRAVVAMVPSHTVWQGLTKENAAVSSWTYKGQPLPFLSGIVEESDFKQAPFKLRPLFERALKLSNTFAAEIPVEKIDAPILMVSGGDDQIWPSSIMANAVVERLKRNQYPHNYVHLSYPGAGHFIGLPAWPTSGRIFNSMYAGGTQEADGMAGSDSWPRVLDFLQDASTH